MLRLKPLLILLAAAASCHLPLARAADKPPLRIGWVFAMANAPAIIADKKGFYAAEGLKVEVKSFGDGPVVQQALAAGELDVAYVGAPPVYQWFSRGLDSRILAKVNYGQAAVIADRSEGVKTVADLKGKKLAGVARGSGMDVLLRGFVLKEIGGLDPDKDVDIVSMPPANMATALQNQQVDAIFTWEPFASESLLSGRGRLVLDVNQKLPNYPWYVVMAPAKTLKERPDDVIRLLRAHIKAIDFLQKNPDEANRIIADAFQIAPIKNGSKTIEPLAVVQEARKRLGWAWRLEAADQQFIQRLMDYSLSLGFMNKALKVEQVVDTSWLQRAEQGR
ncbi:NitT/TauT family transport system substrate-binding protein [Andreprevotia lacus DSM 23236]|jgi:NitT/TauT family transport system substrate-binding protein|uniref:NitT/TauT family transport system substrate-binding protein n=1 Tax=Andreprevotia lacus DSM 23236 TaxID=1121001 RepID=A0A1W1Y063_9NEIS|nr:ABC transporter substrate-binding protein [Andreprevotia lacus]SMC29609.1 NitT/TauT family transport system substrate-binding protein [Andreprevotia lacus DSM 23236]